MPRATLALLMFLTTAGCGRDSAVGPEGPDLSGVWQLVSVDGHALPVSYYPFVQTFGFDTLHAITLTLPATYPPRAVLRMTRSSWSFTPPRQRMMEVVLDEAVWSFDGGAAGGAWPMRAVYMCCGLRSGAQDDAEFRGPNTLTLWRTFETGRRAFLFRR